jgi:hypothetical protein
LFITSTLLAIIVLHIIEIFNNSLLPVTDNTSCWYFWGQIPNWDKAVDHMGWERATMITMAGVAVLFGLFLWFVLWLNSRVEDKEQEERIQLIKDIVKELPNALKGIVPSATSIARAFKDEFFAGITDKDKTTITITDLSPVI